MKPSIYVGGGRSGIEMTAIDLQPGEEEKIVADALASCLNSPLHLAFPVTAYAPHFVSWGYSSTDLWLRGATLPRNGVQHDQREDFGLSAAELRMLRGLKTPALIQKFLDKMEYQYADTAGSVRWVLRERKGHCLEGALLAAAALRLQGHPPLLMDLETVRDDDHVLALYCEQGLWGSIAKSNYAGLRFRAPVYRTLRELAMSYFEDYYNPRGERTLRGYSQPVNLKRFDKQNWMTSEEDVWFVPEYLVKVKHSALFPHKVARALPRMDKRSYEAGMHGWVRHKANKRATK